MKNKAWYSLDWFGVETLGRFDWVHPMWLYLPAVVLALLVLRALLSRSRAWEWAWGGGNRMPWHWSSYLRFISPLLLLLAITGLALALARPQLVNDQVERWSEGIDIMLVLDISESMKIEDFSPNRLRAAQDVAKEFVLGRTSDRIGLIVFSGDAFSKTPLTQDYDLILDEIKRIDFGLISTPGTAIGSALATAINRMRQAKAKSKVIILLSDGDNTAGQIDPITAAKLAEAYGIKIYTIAIGKEGKVPFGRDFFGRRQYVENTLDETTLRKVAQIGNGTFYRAANKTTLNKVFEQIDELEKTEIKERRYRQRNDYYGIYLRWALCLLLVYWFVKPWLGNPLQE